MWKSCCGAGAPRVATPAAAATGAYNLWAAPARRWSGAAPAAAWRAVAAAAWRPRPGAAAPAAAPLAGPLRSRGGVAGLTRAARAARRRARWRTRCAAMAAPAAWPTWRAGAGPAGAGTRRLHAWHDLTWREAPCGAWRVHLHALLARLQQRRVPPVPLARASLRECGATLTLSQLFTQTLNLTPSS